jgi:divalent metal cation (Fe/Co/Zn/Cd) transporter
MQLSLSIAAGSLVINLAVPLSSTVRICWTALESIINVVTAAGAIVAIRGAARPSDAEHSYGHHKAEYLPAVVGSMRAAE